MNKSGRKTRSNERVFLLVDSHAHLNVEDFDKDRDAIIQRAFEAGIGAILCPAEATDEKNLQTTLEMVENYSNIIAAAGAHPHHAKDFRPEYRDRIITLAKNKQICALGEIGLDFHYKFSPPEKQNEIFREQLIIAQDLGLPVIIHSRLASREIYNAVKRIGFSHGGVLHCFTEEWDFAEKMLEKGFFISFSGILTFPKAISLRETAKKVPLEKLLLETDSPYLTPVPFRGKIKRNEPMFLKETAKHMAELRGMDIEELAVRTRKNFERCFQFEIKKH